MIIQITIQIITIIMIHVKTSSGGCMGTLLEACLSNPVFGNLWVVVFPTNNTHTNDNVNYADTNSSHTNTNTNTNKHNNYSPVWQ